MKHENSDMVEQAFDNTDPEYLEKSVLQRNPGPEAAGSTFLSPIQVDDLKYADWQPANDPDVQAPAIGLKANIPGLLGFCSLDNLDPQQMCRIQPGHMGKAIIRNGPNAGKVAAELVTVFPEGDRKVDFTTLLLGPDRNDPDKLMVWTFFPGAAGAQYEPMAFEDIQKEFGVSGDQTVECTVEQAQSLGFMNGKHVSTL